MSTQNDKLILNTIFNPFEPTKIEDEPLNDGQCSIEHPELKIQNLEKLKQIELEGVKLAELGNVFE